jgi:hypothetical protein
MPKMSYIKNAFCIGNEDNCCFQNLTFHLVNVYLLGTEQFNLITEQKKERDKLS